VAIVALLAATLVASHAIPTHVSLFRDGHPWAADPSVSAQLQQGVATPLVQRVCYDGSAVLLTCYTRQPDGRWVRTEMQEDTTWVVIGTVTDDEVQTAVAAANARSS
jgi:hypothetical protein